MRDTKAKRDGTRSDAGFWRCATVRFWLISVLWLASLPTDGSRARISAAEGAPSSEVLDRIYGDWERRQHRIDRVRYTIQGSTTFLQGFASKSSDEGSPLRKRVVPREDLTFPVRLVLTLDFQNNRVRKELDRYYWTPDIESFLPDELIKVFDGKTQRMKRLLTSEQRQEFKEAGQYPIDIYLQSERARSDMFEPEEYPVFAGHGVIPVGKAFRADRLRAPPLRGALYIHGNATHRGRPVSVLRTPNLGDEPGNFRELWVDVEHNSAIVKFASYYKGQEGSRFDATYARVDDEWLPKQWVYTRVFSGATVDVTTLEARHVDLNPKVTEKDFFLPVEEGMVVFDAVAQRRYVSGGLTGPELSVEDIIAREQMNSSSRWLMAFVVAGFAIAALLVLHVRRRFAIRTQ